MNNPYSVLGVSPNDSEDTVKKAYREKAFEIESANISEGEKQARMSELDSAFDAVFNEKRGTSYSSAQYSASTQFPDVRQQIKDGRLEDASTILDGIPENMRSAEWYYLKGVIHRSRGWLNEAHSCFQTAVSLDSQNAEYREAFEAMQKKANGGYKMSDDLASGCCDCCYVDCCPSNNCLDCLCDLWCCDSICECFGGDLCGCC